MNTEQLVQMANRIGHFFDAMPDRAEALEGIAQHIRRYWEPRMRRQLLDGLDAPEAGALHPLVAEAVRAKAAQLAPGA